MRLENMLSMKNVVVFLKKYNGLIGLYTTIKNYSAKKESYTVSVKLLAKVTTCSIEYFILATLNNILNYCYIEVI